MPWINAESGSDLVGAVGVKAGCRGSTRTCATRTSTSSTPPSTSSSHGETCPSSILDVPWQLT
eukprot:3835589-Rhodomonas_salina.2